MQRIVRAASGCGIAAMLVALLPLTAVAHEQRDVAGGQYTLVVGFLDEPAFVGLKNGLDLRVEKHEAGAAASPAAGAEEAGTPVEGLVGTLRAEVIYGDQTMELELEPRFGEPGAYRGIFFPTAEGDYSFRISGEIEGVQIDETFTSSPETFSSVQPVEPLQFPKEESSRNGAGAAAATIGGDDGNGTTIGSLAVGLGVVAGAAGLWLIQRRTQARRSLTPGGTRVTVRR